MERSEQINELCAAMAQLQGDIKQPELDCKVNITAKSGYKIKYDYASLGEVQKVLKEPMKKAGLSIIQYDTQKNGRNYLVSFLSHSSGQYMQFDTPLLGAMDEDPKKFGSAKTYARRYALYGIFNLYGQLDTDAQEIEPEETNSNIDRPITMQEYKKLSFYLDKLPDYKKRVEEALVKKGVENIFKMPKSYYQDVLGIAKTKYEQGESNGTGQ